MAVEFTYPRVAEFRHQSEDGAHGELRLMNSLWVGYRSKDINRRLVNMSHHRLDVVRQELLALNNLQQSIGRRMSVPAGSVIFERRFDQRPSLAERFGEVVRMSLRG